MTSEALILKDKSHFKYFIFNVKDRQWWLPFDSMGNPAKHNTTNLEDAGEFTFGECRKHLLKCNQFELTVVMVPTFAMDYMTPL